MKVRRRLIRVTRPARVVRPAPRLETHLHAALARQPVQMHPSGFLVVRQGPGRHAGILPPNRPGAAPQYIQGLLGISARPQSGLLGMR